MDRALGSLQHCGLTLRADRHQTDHVLDLLVAVSHKNLVIKVGAGVPLRAESSGVASSTPVSAAHGKLISDAMICVRHQSLTQAFHINPGSQSCSS